MNIQPFKLERYYAQYEHTAKYSLCNSDCEAMVCCCGIEKFIIIQTISEWVLVEENWRRA